MHQTMLRKEHEWQPPMPHHAENTHAQRMLCDKFTRHFAIATKFSIPALGCYLKLCNASHYSGVAWCRTNPREKHGGSKTFLEHLHNV